jgi:hypothetical protein
MDLSAIDLLISTAHALNATSFLQLLPGEQEKESALVHLKQL